MLEENETLLTLNIESNRLTGSVIADICKATLKKQSLVDLRLSNQRSQTLGNKVEMEIANTIAQNNKLLRLGIHLDTLGPRVKVQETLRRNWDLSELRETLKPFFIFLIKSFNFKLLSFSSTPTTQKQINTQKPTSQPANNIYKCKCINKK